jgi:hypothetical protein
MSQVIFGQLISIIDGISHFYAKTIASPLLLLLDDVLKFSMLKNNII